MPVAGHDRPPQHDASGWPDCIHEILGHQVFTEQLPGGAVGQRYLPFSVQSDKQMPIRMRFSCEVSVEIFRVPGAPCIGRLIGLADAQGHEFLPPVAGDHQAQRQIRPGKPVRDGK